jgi:hypothetical protein
MNLNPIKANMTELEIKGMTVLFSYRTPVACISIDNGRMIKLCTSKKWSKTTTRHINAWFEGGAAHEVPQEYFDRLVDGTSNLITEVK